MSDAFRPVAELALTTPVSQTSGTVSKAKEPDTWYAATTKAAGNATPTDPVAQTTTADREIFTDANKVPEPEVQVRVYAPKFRCGAASLPAVLPPMGVGKIGVLSAKQAETLEQTFFNRLTSAGARLEYRSHEVQASVLMALHIYLAINGGSIGNADGFGGNSEGSQPLRVYDIEVPLKHIVQIFGAQTYAYMRYRATEIRDALERVFLELRTSPDPSQDLLELNELIRVTAVKRDLASYPQYIAVGSEYAYGTPCHVAALVLRSGACITASTSNIRDETSKNAQAARTTK